MGSLSIQKGKRAERQVANLLNPIIARVCEREGIDVCKLQRNLKQVQQGGFDLDSDSELLSWLAIEIKHHKQPSLGSWWGQCCRQAINGRIPVLIWKPHGGTWRVRMTGQLPLSNGQAIRGIVDMPDLSSFLVWFELELTTKIRDGIACSDGSEEDDVRQSSPASSAAVPVASEPAALAPRPWE